MTDSFKLIDEAELSEKAFYKTFDALEEGKAVLAELEVECGPAEWRAGIGESKKYHIASFESTKLSLANLINIPAKEFNKTLFADLCKISETLHSERLFVALSRKSPHLANIMRSLTVYGFEKASMVEQAKFTTNPEIIMLKIDLNQEEDDFVDI